MSDAEWVVDFPTLGDVGDAWITQHARVPDSFDRGKPFTQANWQFWCTANHYRVREDAQWIPDRPLLNQAFTYRRSQIVGPQKLGKGPWAAGIIALEAVGPTIFGGWAGKDDGYACSDFGCGCGWEYEYLPGEPMGIRQPSPLIQVTAVSQDQAKNVFRPLRAMIQLGPLSDLLIVRGDHIKILGVFDDPELDRIDMVTSSGSSRLGNPISFALQDESGKATKQNKMVDVYETQRRGAAGMGGRTMETTNAFDPSENSVAQRTWNSTAKDIFRYWRRPPADLSYANRRDRQKIHKYVYFGSPWVDIKSIGAEAEELFAEDPAQAERFFGNRDVAGSGTWLKQGLFEKKHVPGVIVKPRTKVALGFDGSDNEDWTGIRLCTRELYHFTPRYGADERPTQWRPTGDPLRIDRSEVRQAFHSIMNEFTVVRAYLDPPYWGSEIDALAERYGEEIFIKWPTYTIGRMWGALERYRTDLAAPEGEGLMHDGDRDVTEHAKNAIMRTRAIDPLTRKRQYILAKPDGRGHQKIDFLMSDVLAHEAANDAIAAGQFTTETNNGFVYF